MSTRFVIVGTDTNVGKTVFAAGLCGLLGATYWKPIQSGLDDPTDSDTVAALAGLAPDRILPEAWRLRTPASPHRAAALDGVRIDPAGLTPPRGIDPLIIESAGGVLVLVDGTTTFADVIARWGIPVILCARTTLGTINHSLLTLEALRARAVQVHGIAFIGDANDNTEESICSAGQVRRLGRLQHLDPLTPATLRAAFAQAFAPAFDRAMVAPA